MDVKDLQLDAISFSQAPTKSQLVNTLRAIHSFLAKMGGSLLMDESYTIGDQPMGVMLNASVMLKQAADQFDAGPSASGLAVPQPPAGMRRG